MNKLEIGEVAENIFSAVNLYINRYMADMKKYVDGQIDTLKTQPTKQSDDAVIAQTKEYVRREIEEALPNIRNKSANADAGTPEELSQIVRGLERRAGRHAEHLLKLESRIRTLEGKKNEG
jgi:hypothetical protein